MSFDTRRRRRLRNTRFPAVRYHLTEAGLSPAGTRQLRLTHRNRKFESISLQRRARQTQAGKLGCWEDEAELTFPAAQSRSPPRSTTSPGEASVTTGTARPSTQRLFSVET